MTDNTNPKIGERREAVQKIRGQAEAHNLRVEAMYEAMYESLYGQAAPDAPTATEPDVVEEVKTWLKADTLALRMWIYRVAMAVLIIVAGWQGWQAVTTEQWTHLLEALLAIGGAGIADLARRNVR